MHAIQVEAVTGQLRSFVAVPETPTPPYRLGGSGRFDPEDSARGAQRCRDSGERRAGLYHVATRRYGRGWKRGNEKLDEAVEESLAELLPLRVEKRGEETLASNPNHVAAGDAGEQKHRVARLDPAQKLSRVRERNVLTAPDRGARFVADAKELMIRGLRDVHECRVDEQKRLVALHDELVGVGTEVPPEPRDLCFGNPHPRHPVVMSSW